MRFNYTPFIALVIFTLSIASCTTNYYVVRHAEKTNAPQNPPLSQAGLDRAVDLKEFLEDKGVDNIYVSQLTRTQQTAQPTANSTGITPVVFNVPTQNQALINQLQTHTDNRTILVVNHSNTVPNIVDALMQSPQGIVIPESDYDNLYHVRIKRFGSPKYKLTQLTFGQPTN